MDNTPAVDEVVARKKNVLFEVTTLSKVLAVALFISLPFIGGWIGYNLQASSETDKSNSTPRNFNEVQNKIDAPTQSDYFSIFEEIYELENASWASSTISHFGEEVVIEYPENMPIRQKGLHHFDYGSMTFGLLLEADDLPKNTYRDDMVLWAKYTHDLKYLFYLKNTSNHSALYGANVQTKQIKRITTYDFMPFFSSLEKEENPIYVPEISNDLIIYNKQIEPNSEKFVGVIASLNNYKRLWEAPCERRYQYDFSPDNLHILWTCDDGIYVSDWVETKKILTDSETLRPRNATFIANDRISFYSALNDNLFDSQEYSVKIDGSDLVLDNPNPTFIKPH